MNSLSRVQLFVTPWTVAYQALPSMGFSRHEYWSGLPFPSPGGLPDPGIEPGSPALRADTLPSAPAGKSIQGVVIVTIKCILCSVSFRLLKSGDFPGGPVVKTPCFECRGLEFDP